MDAPAAKEGALGAAAEGAKGLEPTALAENIAEKIFGQEPKESDSTLTAFKETISKINNLKKTTSCAKPSVPIELTSIDTKGKRVLETFLLSLNSVFSKITLKGKMSINKQMETLLEPELRKLNENLKTLTSEDQILCIDTLQPFIIYFVLKCVDLIIDELVNKNFLDIQKEIEKTKSGNEIVEIIKGKRNKYIGKILEIICDLTDLDFNILQEKLIKVQGEQYVFEDSYPQLKEKFSNPFSKLQEIAGDAYKPKDQLDLSKEISHTGRCGTYTLRHGGKAKKKTRKQKKKKQKLKSGKKNKNKSKRRKGSRKK